MQNFFNTKFAALNQATYRPMNLKTDKMTNEGFAMAAYGNTNEYNVTGADFGFGTHGYVNAREQAILNNGEAVVKGQNLNLFGWGNKWHTIKAD